MWRKMVNRTHGELSRSEKKCNYCKKSGHIQKVCKKKQKDEEKRKNKSKIGKVEEELSEISETETESDPEDSSEKDSSSEDTSNDDQSFGERCGRVREINRIPLKKNKKGILIAKIQEIKPKDGKTIEFEMTVNGCKLTAILDTGSPITIMP